MTDLIKTPSNEVQETLKALDRAGVTQEHLKRIRSEPELAKAIAKLIRGQGYILKEREFYTLLSDDEAIVWIVKQAKKSEEEARQIVNGFRKQARRQGVPDDVKIHAEVHPGCTFKQDIPRMGPCWKDFQYLQHWDFLGPPTEHCLVSWIPSPFKGSTNKNVTEQSELVNSFKVVAELPPWYEISFGSLNHVAGLALAHFKTTGKDPFADLIVHTNSCYVGGRRLWLGWNEGRLYCDFWRWGDYRYFDRAVFAVGVVKALGR